MIAYRFTPKALDDLLEILAFIARDSPQGAGRVVAAIQRNCELLAESPFAGRERAELAPPPLRFWNAQPYRNYLIVYDPTAIPIQIIRILHGARSLPWLLP